MANRLLLYKDIRGDWPIGHTTIAKAGVYEDPDIQVNRYGAVCVKASNGKMLGVKPDEMEWIERN